MTYVSASLPPKVFRWRVLPALFVDAMGTGLFAPFAFLYYSATTDLGYAEVGTVISIATLISLAVTPLIGRAIDRFGYGRIIVTALLTEAVGYGAALAVRNLAGLLVVTLVIQLGVRAFFPANSTLIAENFVNRSRDAAFAASQVARNAGAGTGALLATAALAGTDSLGVTVIVALNSVSFVVAAGAFWSLRGSRSGRKEKATTRLAERHALRLRVSDGPFLLFVVANVPIVMALLALDIAIPAYVVDDLGLQPWAASGLYALNTVLVVTLQTLLTRAAAPFRRRLIYGTGALALAVSFVALGLLTLFSLPLHAILAVLIVGIALFSAGEMLVGPTGYAMAADAAPKGRRGEYMNIFHLSWSVGAVLAPVVLGWTLDRSPVASWVLLAAATLPVGLLIVTSGLTRSSLGNMRGE